MGRKLRSHWKLVLVLGLIIILLDLTIYVKRDALISYVGMKLVAAEQTEVDPGKLTLADFSEIPGVTQDYVDAYKIFLRAMAGDKATPAYADAAAAFGKVAASTKNPELKLRGLYMVTLANFLQGKIDDAYKSAQEVLVLSKKLLPKDNRVLKLEKVVSAITKGDVKDIKGLKTEIADASSAEFAEDLNGITEGQKDYLQLKEKREARKTAQK